jgi:hypothetical protein
MAPYGTGPCLFDPVQVRMSIADHHPSSTFPGEPVVRRAWYSLALALTAGVGVAGTGR